MFWVCSHPAVCLDSFGFVRSDRNLRPNGANTVPKRFVYTQFGLLLAKPHVFADVFWSTVHFADQTDVNLEVIPVWGQLVGLAVDHGRLGTHELAVLSCMARRR